MNYLILQDQSLKHFNTLKLNSQARNMAFPFNKTGLQQLYQLYNDKKRIILLGKGSNILFSKELYGDNYLFINLKLMDQMLSDDCSIFAEAGATLSDLAWYSIENNIKGFEFLEDIPGSVGGAIVMNAGTYTNSIGQLMEKITYYQIDRDEIISETVKSSDLGIRKSKWSNSNTVILACNFKAKKGDYLKSLDELLEIKKNRYLKQPRNYPNAGSVFKRPIVNGQELEVWKLINDVGLRGFKINDAQISEKHTGFIVNTGNATYEDTMRLINISKEKVMETFNIELELEWKII